MNIKPTDRDTLRWSVELDGERINISTWDARDESPPVDPEQWNGPTTVAPSRVVLRSFGSLDELNLWMRTKAASAVQAARTRPKGRVPPIEEIAAHPNPEISGPAIRRILEGV